MTSSPSATVCIHCCLQLYRKVHITSHQQCLMCHHIMSKFIFITTSNLPLHTPMYYILMSTTITDTQFTHSCLLPIQVVKGSEQHVQSCLSNSQYTNRWVENLQETISLCNIQNVVCFLKMGTRCEISGLGLTNAIDDVYYV